MVTILVPTAPPVPPAAPALPLHLFEIFFTLQI